MGKELHPSEEGILIFLEVLGMFCTLKINKIKFLKPSANGSISFPLRPQTVWKKKCIHWRNGELNKLLWATLLQCTGIFYITLCIYLE